MGRRWQGDGEACNVTVSWNDFDGTNEYSPCCHGKHYGNLLSLGEATRVLVERNHFRQNLPGLGYVKRFAPAGDGLMSFEADQARRGAPHFAGPGHD